MRPQAVLEAHLFDLEVELQCLHRLRQRDFFFFSGRRRHTRWNCDWSSDVCSSDLAEVVVEAPRAHAMALHDAGGAGARHLRSEERRVGKEGTAWLIAFSFKG